MGMRIANIDVSVDDLPGIRLCDYDAVYCRGCVGHGVCMGIF